MESPRHDVQPDAARIQQLLQIFNHTTRETFTKLSEGFHDVTVALSRLGQCTEEMITRVHAINAYDRRYRNRGRLLARKPGRRPRWN